MRFMDAQTNSLAKPLVVTSNPKIFIAVLVVSILLGIVTGYLLSNKTSSTTASKAVTSAVKIPQQDSVTFRDFAAGTIKARPEPKNSDEYVEGTHLLERPGATSVALTSSVVDLSKYEGKKVKLFGETQKALKEGWLMDVGKVEEE